MDAPDEKQSGLTFLKKDFQEEGVESIIDNEIAQSRGVGSFVGSNG